MSEREEEEEDKEEKEKHPINKSEDQSVGDNK